MSCPRQLKRPSLITHHQFIYSRCKELVRDRSLRDPWTFEQTSRRMQWRYGGSININLLCAFLVIFITIPFTILVCNFLIMSIQVLASVKKGKPELRKKVQLCQQCLIYISIYLMLLQHCFYTFEELNNIALSIHIIYINIFVPADNFIYSTTYVYHQCSWKQK